MAELEALLIDLAGKTQAEIEDIAWDAYRSLCDESHKARSLLTHDGRVVMFYEDRFEHAFFTSSNRARHPNWKDKLAVERVERIRWIREFIAGKAAGVECWETERLDGRLLPKMRIYLTWKPTYLVWLDELSDGFRFKFSSAYGPQTGDLRRYCKAGRKLWPLEGA